MKRRTIGSLLLTGALTATTAACTSGTTPPAPDVKTTEQVQPPVKLTARDTVQTAVVRG